MSEAASIEQLSGTLSNFAGYKASKLIDIIYSTAPEVL